jgi:hypothetical protein
MFLRRLCLLTLAATLAASTTVGTLNVRIQEYEVPTTKSRPHDPAVAPDGSLWYTGQAANKLGRLDLKTGEFKEYPLKTLTSGPHGLVADKDGNIWFTAISGGYVGKLNPKTGEITEYRPADGTEIDPHTPAFDHNGILWFTNEETNYVGRLDPKTGKIALTKIAHAARGALRHCDLAEQYALLLRVRRQQAGQHRPEHNENPRIHVAGSRCAPTTDRAGAGRHGLLHRLRARLSGTFRSVRRRAGKGMVVTRWLGV